MAEDTSKTTRVRRVVLWGRRFLAATVVVPPDVAERLNTDAMAVLAVIRDETRATGKCTLPVARIAERANIVRAKTRAAIRHLNERGFWDVAAISKAPLVATHSNAHALSPHSRNLTDKQLAAVRETGGIVGVNFATNFLRPDGRRDADTPTELVIDHLEHVLEQVGEDGVGFGSDLDGAKIPRGIGNAAGLQRLVEIMRTRGFGKPLIEKVCFKNWLRVLDRPGAGRIPRDSAPVPSSRSSRVDRVLASQDLQMKRSRPNRD
jgi:hypothetical protein